MKINPLIAVGIYVIVHILVSIVLMMTVYTTGGENFQFLVDTFRYMMYGILIVTVLFSAAQYRWAMKNWWVVFILILIGLSPVLVNVLLK